MLYLIASVKVKVEDIQLYYVLDRCNAWFTFDKIIRHFTIVNDILFNKRST